MDKAEAEFAIRNVIALYGLAADCGDVETALACHTEDAEYVVSNPRAGRDGSADDLHLKGHAAIRSMLESELHQSLLPNCAHTVGPLVVKVGGDTANALGYSRVYHLDADRPTLMRVAFNLWSLRVDSDQWKICYRESRVMGEAQAQALLKREVAAFR